MGLFFFNTVWAWIKKTIFEEEPGSVPMPKPQIRFVKTNNYHTGLNDVKLTCFVLNGGKEKSTPRGRNNKRSLLLGDSESTSEGSGSNRSSCRCNDASEQKKNCFACEQKAKKKPVMLLPPTLGQAGFSLYYLIVNEFGDEYTYITWDTRNVSTSAPGRWVEDCARDGQKILQDLGYDKAEVVCGASQGVQVALEFGKLFPEQVDRIVLINGSHGNVMSLFLQPFGSIPFFDVFLRWAFRRLKNHIELMYSVLELFAPLIIMMIEMGTIVYSNLWLRRNKHWSGGTDFLKHISRDYFENMVGKDKKYINYFSIYGELDSHSVYEALPSIKAPVLILSSLFDPFTPYCASYSMASRLPDCKHHCSFMSTHVSLIEDSTFILNKMREFLGGKDKEKVETGCEEKGKKKVVKKNKKSC